MGVLVDWDYSVNPSETSSLFSHAVDVSTLAIDPLLGRAWGNFYRYHLVSFFYILVWPAIHYDLERRTPGSVHWALKGWVSRDVQTNACAKDVFVTGSASYEDVYGAIRKEFEEIRVTLIEPLHDLLYNAFQSRALARRRRKAEYNYETCDGILTFDAFMEAINVDPRLSGSSGA